jgi:hypothetical protein
MIIRVTGRLWGEDGILVIEDPTSKLLIRTESLPTDVVLKSYLLTVRQGRTSGKIKSKKDGLTYDWEVLKPGAPKRRGRAKVGRMRRTAVLV